MDNRQKAKLLLNARFTTLFAGIGERYTDAHWARTNAIVDALMGEPEPAKLDAPEIKTLITRLIAHAQSDGWCRALLYTGQDEPVTKMHQDRASDAVEKTRADLLALLRIEES